jgi:hypothetical protein
LGIKRDNPFLQKADCLSKGIYSDNWGIFEEDFCHLGALFGPFTIDLFATSDNAKCLRFYSRSFEEGALEMGGGVRFCSTPCIFGNADNLQGSRHGNGGNFARAFMERSKILDLGLQGRAPFEWNVCQFAIDLHEGFGLGNIPER